MQFVKDIADYHSKSDRIEGWRPLLEFGLKIPTPVKTVTHEGFIFYKKNKVTGQLKDEVLAAFEEIRQKNPDRGVYVGRGYFVPGLQAPPGPRSSSVKSPDVALSEVEKLFEFAINNNFDKPGAEINIIMHPFINPIVPMSGGCITPSRHSKSDLIVEAIYGNDEGVQSFYHDTFYVNVDKMIITKKVIQNKPQCLQATDDFKYETIELPSELQDVQCVDDFTILSVTRDFKKLIDKYGPHRVEFAVQSEGVYFRDYTPFEFSKDLNISAFANTKGTVIKVSTLDEVKNIKNTSQILYIDPLVIQQRNMDLLTSLAYNFDQPMIVLYPGSASTAHAATILREKGHSVCYVGGTQFESGDKVLVTVKGNDLVVEKILENKQSWVLPSKFSGGKSARIWELDKAGIRVPKFFSLSSEALDYYLEENNLITRIDEISEERNKDILELKLKDFRNKIENGKIPEDLESLITEAFEKLNQPVVSVRSSANVEDGTKASFAGLFETVLKVDKTQLLISIKICWAALYNLGAFTYAKHHNIPIYSMKMGLLIMEMLDPAKAGVLFTKDLSAKDDLTCVIEAVEGLGDKVVDGLGEPDVIKVNKNNQSIVSQTKNIMSQEEIKTLVTLGISIENKYNTPQDIEWAISKKGEVFILQTRPITT